MPDVLTQPQTRLSEMLFPQSGAWALQQAAVKRLDTARELLAALGHNPSGLRASGPALTLLLEDAAGLYQAAFLHALEGEERL